MEIIMWVCAVYGGIMVLDNNWNAAIAFGGGLAPVLAQVANLPHSRI